MRLPAWVAKLLGRQKPRADDSSGPTPKALDEEQAAAARREDADEHFPVVAEEDDSPRSDSDV
jgi:hypothetical protein